MGVLQFLRGLSILEFPMEVGLEYLKWGFAIAVSKQLSEFYFFNFYFLCFDYFKEDFCYKNDFKIIRL